jgi:dGTPase
MEDGFHAGLITFKNLKSPTERAELSRTTLAYCGSDVTPGELTEILDELLALDIWPHSYDGGPAAASALKNLTSELIGRFCVAAQQATLSTALESEPDHPSTLHARPSASRAHEPTTPNPISPLSHTSPIGHSFTRYAANLVVPRRQRLECALLKGITARYVMARAGAAQAQARERELLAELAHAVERGAPGTLDPLFRPSWEQAGSDAAQRRVVIDQVASLTDTSAIAWHHRLCAP